MSGAAPAGKRRVWTPSNVITITRILLVPVFVAALLAPWPEWFGMNNAFSNDWKSVVAAAIFVLISCTDWLDGYLARSRNEVTDFGKFMDPLADKILVAAALISLVELGDLPTWVVLVILAREFIVSGIRMMAASKGVVIAASMLGKCKTVFQMIAIVLFTVKGSHMIGSFGEAARDGLWDVSWLVMITALVLTVASMVDYLIKGREVLGFDSGGEGDSPSIQDEGDAEVAQCADRCGLQADHAFEERLSDLAEKVVSRGLEKGMTVATAESLTGGMIGACLTSVPGSSAVYLGGVNSYTNQVKSGLLGVSESVLASEGAVCAQVACEMAEGARAAMGSDLSVAVTGIAGPGGAEPGKPVGLVWMSVSSVDGTRPRKFMFEGTRSEVRLKTTEAALSALADRLGS